MEKYVAVRDKENGNIKVCSNGQVNSFSNTENGYEHTYYNPNTGRSGWHGDRVSKEEKAFMADVSRYWIKYLELEMEFCL